MFGLHLACACCESSCQCLGTNTNHTYSFEQLLLSVVEITTKASKSSNQFIHRYSASHVSVHPQACKPSQRRSTHTVLSAGSLRTTLRSLGMFIECCSRMWVLGQGDWLLGLLDSLGPTILSIVSTGQETYYALIRGPEWCGARLLAGQYPPCVKPQVEGTLERNSGPNGNLECVETRAAVDQNLQRPCQGLC